MVEAAVVLVAERDCLQLPPFPSPRSLNSVVEAMEAHPQALGVQLAGCRVLGIVCGGNATAPAFRQRTPLSTLCA